MADKKKVMTTDRSQEDILADIKRNDHLIDAAKNVRGDLSDEEMHGKSSAGHPAKEARIEELNQLIYGYHKARAALYDELDVARVRDVGHFDPNEVLAEFEDKKA